MMSAEHPPVGGSGPRPRRDGGGAVGHRRCKVGGGRRDEDEQHACGVEVGGLRGEEALEIARISRTPSARF